MLTGIHCLLTYRCNFECDHCFLYCSPRAPGTFTVDQIRRVIDEARAIGTVDTIYYEGGEPFLFYPLMVEGIRLARAAGMKAGVVTNAYWATAPEDADLWLRPLHELGVFDLSLSDDEFHRGDDEVSSAVRALSSAGKLGLPARSICIEGPKVRPSSGAEAGEGGGGSGAETGGGSGGETGGGSGGETGGGPGAQAGENDAVGRKGQGKGEPVVGGDVVFRGRAVDKLVEGLPGRPWREFTECKREELERPKRVHVDSFGNVHICQGISMGNMWRAPLSEIVSKYSAESHPICGPLSAGGPAELAETYGVRHDEEYVDECHFCYSVRKALLSRFPDRLGPRQVYGIEPGD